MEETLLYVVLPYAALVAWIVVPLCRLARPAVGAPARLPEARRPLPWSLRYGLALLLAGHLLALILPRQVALVGRQPWGLLALEGSAFAVGGLALVGFVGMLAAYGQGSRPAPLAETLLGTLVAIALLAGLAGALIYRWSSAWYTATVVPYVDSLLRLRPDPSLIAELPPLVRLHVLSGIAAIATSPFTRWGRLPGRLAPRWRLGVTARRQGSGVSG